MCSIFQLICGCCADTAADIDTCCKAGLMEAESCRDIEMQAEFLYCGAIYSLVSEKPVDKVMTILQACVFWFNFTCIDKLEHEVGCLSQWTLSYSAC